MDVASQVMADAASVGLAACDDMIHKPPPTSPVQALAPAAEDSVGYAAQVPLGLSKAEPEPSKIAPEYHAGPINIRVLSA